MDRKQLCQACSNEKHGVKSRNRVPHTCGKIVKDGAWYESFPEHIDTAQSEYGRNKELRIAQEIVDRGICPGSVLVAVSAVTPIHAAMDASSYLDLSQYPLILEAIRQTIEEIASGK